MRVPKDLLPPPQKRIFFPKIGIFGHVGLVWPCWVFLAHLVPCLTKNDANEVPRWFSDTWVTKLLIPPQKNRTLAPQRSNLPKMCIFGHFSQILAVLAHLVPCPAKITMQTRCLESVFWYVGTKKIFTRKMVKIFGPKGQFFPQNMLSWAHDIWALPAGSFGALLVGW